jgi:hypothetical protein
MQRFLYSEEFNGGTFPDISPWLEICSLCLASSDHFSSMCNLCTNFLFLQEHQSYWITVYTAELALTYILYDSISKSNHILKYRGLRLQHMNFKEDMI